MLVNLRSQRAKGDTSRKPYHLTSSVSLNISYGVGFKSYQTFNDLLLVALLAQFKEHCIRIAKYISSNPIQSRIFFRPYFNSCLSSVHHCKDCFNIHLLKHSSHI